MIWLCVFPTLTVINLTLSDWLRPMSPVLRTFVLATIAVPIVIYGLMPQLHRARARWLAPNAPDQAAVQLLTPSDPGVATLDTGPDRWVLDRGLQQRAA